MQEVLTEQQAAASAMKKELESKLSALTSGMQAYEQLVGELEAQVAAQQEEHLGALSAQEAGLREEMRPGSP